MRKALVLTAGLALAFFAGKTFAADKSMKCEVVDVACYMAKGAHGSDHKACAVKCISGGGELALLHGSKLYIPVDKDFHSVRDQFASKAGETVDVNGAVKSKGGVNYLVLSSDAAAK